MKRRIESLETNKVSSFTYRLFFFHQKANIHSIYSTSGVLSYGKFRLSKNLFRDMD